MLHTHLSCLVKSSSISSSSQFISHNWSPGPFGSFLVRASMMLPDCSAAGEWVSMHNASRRKPKGRRGGATLVVDSNGPSDWCWETGHTAPVVSKLGATRGLMNHTVSMWDLKRTRCGELLS